MAVRPAAAGVMKHQVMWSHSGEVCVTTFWTHRAVTADWTVRRNAEHDIIRGWIDNSWQGSAHPPWAATMIKSWRMDVVPPTKFPDKPITPALVGERGGAGVVALPPTINAIVSLRTEAVGASTRGINGHFAWPGVGTDMFTGNTLQAFAQTMVKDRVDELRAALKEGVGGTAQGTWCIVSYVDGGTGPVPVYRAVPLVKLVDHVIVRGVLGVQRRRKARLNSYAVGS
jgi:hypothetical protein